MRAVIIRFFRWCSHQIARDERRVSWQEYCLYLRRKRIGSWGERAARRMLEAQGLATLRANWRSSGGEVDIIAIDRRTLVAVEVKTRHCCLKASYPALGAVTNEKRDRLRRLIRSFVRNNGPLCRRLALRGERVDAIEIYYEKTWFGSIKVVETAWHRGLIQNSSH